MPLQPGKSKSAAKCIEVDCTYDDLSIDCAVDAEWNESDHPRDAKGRFGEGGGTTENVEASSINPPHGVKDKAKLASLISKMESSGWVGRPIPIYEGHAGKTALTGSHRIAAARKAGVEVPTYEVEGLADFVDSEGRTIDDMRRDDDVLAFLEEFGDKDAIALINEEIETNAAEWGAGDDIDIEIPALDASPRLAMDRGARSKDINGWLHVRDCRISKANVCPYMGKEIPDSERLGLQPDQVYYLYRDASALRAAASSFERAPLVIVHKAVTADQPNKTIIIGAVSNVRWQAPYLVADLTVWDGEGIEAIESERQAELSPGYHYRPEMTSGVINGERFDGRMLDIFANHLCIVDTGRTGPDVLVNDQALLRTTSQS